MLALNFVRYEMKSKISTPSPPPGHRQTPVHHGAGQPEKKYTKKLHYRSHFLFYPGFPLFIFLEKETLLFL